MLCLSDLPNHLVDYQDGIISFQLLIDAHLFLQYPELFFDLGNDSLVEGVVKVRYQIPE